ncbi:unnamed protein product [Miscanthus lutarioriparius]|uniref:Uncharacterized protein n=1 Tax=Miscanthus lutarioriparius TaxID=422564 RepID=A0A811MIV0_9POAL|nr:unnamed protein product [Miscanthus lutarioriparius]CAD6344220.1 unnamed protein product [Miscanthus lutarioriparius]
MLCSASTGAPARASPSGWAPAASPAPLRDSRPAALPSVVSNSPPTDISAFLFSLRHHREWKHLGADDHRFSPLSSSSRPSSTYIEEFHMVMAMPTIID